MDAKLLAIREVPSTKNLGDMVYFVIKLINVIVCHLMLKLFSHYYIMKQQM